MTWRCSGSTLGTSGLTVQKREWTRPKGQAARELAARRHWKLAARAHGGPAEALAALGLFLLDVWSENRDLGSRGVGSRVLSYQRFSIYTYVCVYMYSMCIYVYHYLKIRLHSGQSPLLHQCGIHLAIQEIN
ncbi:hypothetical protein HJG60_009381 [Phyllostomus discolor]|uniref:Uncharacterized protein n=1 Tax=Phyllostomus discolor TaxID=89673 RepID=A0A833YL79_9CHIR|nr:hypothetical protein HJG60_009381 [Phyllostomus discolor]